MKVSFIALLVSGCALVFVVWGNFVRETPIEQAFETCKNPGDYIMANEYTIRDGRTNKEKTRISYSCHNLKETEYRVNEKGEKVLVR